MLFGFDITDLFPPEIDFIKIYPEDENSFIGSSNDETRFNLRKSGNREYRLATKDTLTAWGKISIGAQAFDFNQRQSDHNGFYSMKMYMDTAVFFSMVCDSFAFDESRYVNASIDYPANYNLGNRIVKSKKLPGNRLSFFKSDIANGILNITDNKVHEILIVVGDVAGNAVNLRFWIKPKKSLKTVQIPGIQVADSTIVFKFNKVNRFENNEIKVEIPSGCLYDDLVFRYSKSAGSKTMYSDMYYLHDAEVPLHSKIKVSVKATNLPQQLRSKALLVRIDRDGKRSPAGGSFENGYVTTTTNMFDGYSIVVDTIAPVIKPFAENSKSTASLRFTVSDNFSGIKEYKGEVNGQWALVEWDPKNKLMIYRFDKVAQPGKNTFTLFLEDEKGNKNRYSTTFTR